MIETKMATSNVREIGQNIELVDLDFAILYVFRVNELNLAKNIHFLEQHGADKPVEIASCDQTILLQRHDSAFRIIGIIGNGSKGKD